jgi:sortase A
MMVEVDGQERPMWELPDTRAAGWHETSASLGVPGNTVLSGHNTSNGEVFRDLYQLEFGDEVLLQAGEMTYTYAVVQTLILPEAGQPLEVRIENAHYIEPTEDERLTLVTCHPYGSLRNRLIVIAHPVVGPLPSVATPMVPYSER